MKLFGLGLFFNIIMLGSMILGLILLPIVLLLVAITNA